MTNDALLVLQCLFDVIWRLFTSWYIPGTETTPAAFLMFIGVCGLALKFMYRVINIAPHINTTFDDTPVAKVPGYRTGSFSFKKE